MEKLNQRHNQYVSAVSLDLVRTLMTQIDWSLRLIAIKGPKGVGKSTLMRQYVKRNFASDDRHVLYCSADTGYFTAHTLVDTAEQFHQLGGECLLIDEIHKYDNWSREIKEIYDLFPDLRVIVSGSSLLELNSGQADLSRRMKDYSMFGLSLREYIWFEKGIEIQSVTLDDLLQKPNDYCQYVCSLCRPLEYFKQYLQIGYYPFYKENRNAYAGFVENVVNYIVESELPACRGLEIGNVRKIKALLQLLSQMVPYEVDIAKLSRDVGIQRPTTLKYLKNLEEAALIRRLFNKLDNLSDLQKPDKILLDNPNLLYALSCVTPQIGTARESFFCNQLSAAKHKVEYAGYKSGDFRIDDSIIVEVGGKDKGFSQVQNAANAYVAADDIDSATFRKIPLWAFGFLY